MMLVIDPKHDTVTLDGDRDDTLASTYRDHAASRTPLSQILCAWGT